MGIACILCICLVFLLHSSFPQGIDIQDPAEVVYIRTTTKGVVTRSVILECGPTLPKFYIWNFIMPGTENLRAVVYNFDQGPKLQSLAKTFGELTVITGTASLLIDQLTLVAQGLYTCQAVYDTQQGVKVVYYYVHLLVLVPVAKPYVLVSDSSPVEGTPMWMRCGLENGTGPVNYIWERENRDGTTARVAEGNISVINITGISRNFTGWYRCFASNEVNQQRSERIWLDIMFGPDTPQIDVTPYTVSERGYSAFERETVSLMCHAASNPPSLYVWFYNNSQVYTGQQFTITKILRMHAGYYSCVAQNTLLNTRSKTSITLNVYYPPDGNPTCTIFSASNYNDLVLFCSWEGGNPLASVYWTSKVISNDGQGHFFTNTTLIQPSPISAENSTFTCHGSHMASNVSHKCSVTALLPLGNPQCFAYATRNNEYLMLSCSWEGGNPRALLWWVNNGSIHGTSEENSNILVLKSNAAYSGKAFICHAKHPLSPAIKQCTLKLEAPVLITQRSMVSVFEGSDVQMTCILKANYPTTNIIWYNNQRKLVMEAPKKYLLSWEAMWSNLTVREAVGEEDSGQYWCSAANAVGETEIPITLVVKRYPPPPNVTITKILYTSKQRTEVGLEWDIRGSGDLTGFILERQESQTSGLQMNDTISWQQMVTGIQAIARNHKVGTLNPTVTYMFRILAVNHRTQGHPSEAKTPADPPFNAFPAVIGAAICGMIVAAVGTMLLFMYIVRNRNNNPRLHDLIFGMQHSQSRENINYPDDEIASGIEREDEPRPSDSSEPPADTPPEQPPPGDDNEPVNVTITVTATS